MLKVGIVGCGKIADAHALQIQQLEECKIVGACDNEPLMAKQFSERFAVKECFGNLAQLLAEARPDIVHITTPPESHFNLARICLENGCHVYVEKPFTVDAEEAQQLVDLANRNGMKLTAGHNYQFSHAARRMRDLIKNGYLGGPPLHMESYYGYDLGDPNYARTLLGDKQHWVRRLPGQLLHNIISHGVARIAEYLMADDPQVIAYGFTSPVLKAIGEVDIVDELRVIIFDEKSTAYFTFSSQMKPTLHEFRIYGSKNGLILDQSHETVIRLRGSKFKSFADHFVPPVLIAKQHLENLFGNVKLFLARDFHMDSGMKCLIERFYSSIREDGPVPIPYREIVLTGKIMDAIFDQLQHRQPWNNSAFQDAAGALGMVGTPSTDVMSRCEG
jgi:predicted dehydrogenase